MLLDRLIQFDLMALRRADDEDDDHVEIHDELSEIEDPAAGTARQDTGRERGVMLFPDEAEIDPYNPQTFGYMQIGFIRGAHGVRGELKLDSECYADLFVSGDRDKSMSSDY